MQMNTNKAFLRSLMLAGMLVGGMPTGGIPAAIAGNGANFVLYNHVMPEAGERELMLMSDIGQEPDGTRYTAQMLELELGLTDRWATEFMVEGQHTFGQGGYKFTGFRWENRFRLFAEEALMNPVLYIEYEDLSADTKYLMEVSGREDAAPVVKARPRERVLETRLILSQDFGRLNLAANWLNESDLDTGVTAFGYALGINYQYDDKMMLGLEMFGALGDSRKGVTARGSITQHYVGPNVRIKFGNQWAVKIGGAVGLTNVSQDLFRLGVSREF